MDDLEKEQQREGYFCYASFEELKNAGATDIHENVSKTSTANGQMNYGVMTREQAATLIPDGPYCYKRDSKGLSIPCPYWDTILHFPKQSDGYCHFLQSGDFVKDGTMLLFDQCKECGVREDIEYLPEYHIDSDDETTLS